MKRIQLLLHIGKAIFHSGKNIVYANDISSRIPAQLHAMRYSSLERQNVLLAEVLQRHIHLEATIAADGHGFQALYLFHGVYQGSTGIFPIGIKQFRRIAGLCGQSSRNRMIGLCCLR